MNLTAGLSAPFLQTILTIAVVLSASQFAVSQEVSGEDKGRIAKVKYLVNKAGKLFKSKEYEASAKKIREAQAALIACAEPGIPLVVEKLSDDYSRIVKAQKLLKAEGEEFEKMPTLKSFLSASEGSSEDPFADSGSGSKGSSTKSDEKSESKADGEMVSFTRQVAPIIVQYCGQCHIQQERGQFSAATYARLKKGTSKGPAAKPRDLKKSRMILMIESGAMPPTGKPVPAEKLQVLKDWIEQGAKFDGDKKQKKMNLTTFTSADGNDSANGASD